MSTQPSASQASWAVVTHPMAPPDPNSSMSSILLASLTHLQSLSLTLFQSLSPPQTKPPPPPLLGTSALIDADAALASALQLARAHQVRQRRIETLKSEVLELEGRWRDVVQALEDGRRELEAIVTEGDTRIGEIHRAREAAIPYPELLAYAQSLSAFTSAPPNMPETAPPGLPQAPPPLFFPPFPNEEKMRRGHLNAEAPLGVPGETHSVGRPPSPSSPTDQLAHAHANPYRPHDSRPPVEIFDLDLDLNPDL